MIGGQTLPPFDGVGTTLLIPATCGSGFWGALNFFAFLAGKYTGGGKMAEPRQY